MKKIVISLSASVLISLFAVSCTSLSEVNSFNKNSNDTDTIVETEENGSQQTSPDSNGTDSVTESSDEISSYILNKEDAVYIYKENDSVLERQNVSPWNSNEKNSEVFSVKKVNVNSLDFITEIPEVIEETASKSDSLLSDYLFDSESIDSKKLVQQETREETVSDNKDETLNLLVKLTKNNVSASETAEVQTDENSPSSPVEAEEEKSSKATKPAKNSKNQSASVQPSRSVTINRNQSLEVVYPGNGWIYLGETGDTNLIRYAGRKIGETDTVFNLRSRGAGTAILHFYKNDSLTGSFIDDYLEVIINDQLSDGSKVTAPDYAAIIPARPSIYANQDKPSKEDRFVEIENEQVSLSSLIHKDDSDDKSQDQKTETSEDTAASQTQEETSSNKNNDVNNSAAEGTSSNNSSNASTDNSNTALNNQADTGSSSTETSGGSSSTTTKTTTTTTTTETTSSTSPAETSLTDGSQAPADESTFSTAIQDSTESAEDKEIQELLASQATSEQAPLQGSLDSIIGSSSSIIENETVDQNANDLLKKAQAAYNKKEYDKALSYLRDFFNTSTTRLDEGLYLQGQCYEANSSLRDIQAALDSYETLVKNYPSSSKWQDANNRIIYINRFYYNKR